MACRALPSCSYHNAVGFKASSSAWRGFATSRTGRGEFFAVIASELRLNVRHSSKVLATWTLSPVF